MLKKNELEGILPKVKAAAFDACSCLYREDTDLKIETKGPHDYLTYVDLFVSEYLMSHLPKLLPGSIVTSEESKEPAQAYAENGSAPYRWIIDPIDGTNNLVYGLPFYSVSIGLVCKDAPAKLPPQEAAILGVVYHPPSGELFSAAQGAGAYVENMLIPGKPPKAIGVSSETDLDRAIIMCETDPYFDREKNPSMDLIKAVYKNCIDCRITGSAALDMSYLAAGRAHVHFCRHLSPWDYAGGAAILTEAGGIASQWDGSPISFETGKHTNLASNNRVIHEAMLEIVQNFI